MIPDFRSDASNPPGGARPTLGSSVGEIIAGWHRAVKACESTSRIVRAHALIADARREYCWEQTTILRVLPGGLRRPASAGDLEMLARAISYGWFLVLRHEEAGQEPVVLHQVGSPVPSSPLRAQDLPLLLQENEQSPLFHRDAAPGGRIPELPLDPSPLRPADDSTTASTSGPRSAPQIHWRVGVFAGAVAESGLLLGLLLSRRAAFGVAMALLLALLFVAHRLTRRHGKARLVRGEQPPVSSN